MSNDSQPTKSEGSTAPKAPPPLPRRTQTSAPARTPQMVSQQAEAVRVASGEQERKGVVETIRRKLPSFKYQATARLSQPNVQLDSIATAIQNRLPGCQVTTDEMGTIVVKNIDRFLDLGFFDKWITMNWIFRDVNACITLSSQNQCPMLVAGIEQKPSSNFAIFALVCIPFFLVGLVGFGFALIFTNLAQESIRAAVQRLLVDVAQGAA